MTREEILNLIREELDISISVDTIAWPGTGVTVAVKLHLGDEVISDMSDYVELTLD